MNDYGELLAEQARGAQSARQMAHNNERRQAHNDEWKALKAADFINTRESEIEMALHIAKVVLERADGDNECACIVAKAMMDHANCLVLAGQRPQNGGK